MIMPTGRRPIFRAIWFRSPKTNHYTILDQLRLPDSVPTRAVLQVAEYKTA